MNKEKKIRHIDLDTAWELQQEDLPIYEFRNNASFICNYLSKAVRPLRLVGNGSYNMIGVTLTSKESSIDSTFASNLALYDDAVSVNLHVNEEELVAYKKMTNLEDRYEFYLSCLERGYKFAAAGYNIPVVELLNLHQQFRDGGYKNEWIWKKKPLKEYGLYLIFRCRFTTFDFTLSLEVYDLKRTKLITEGLVLRTFPNEVCYKKEFCKIAISNDTAIKNDVFYFDRKLEECHKIINIKEDTLYILDFLSMPNFAINLIKLQNGEFNVEYLMDIGKDDSAERIEFLTW